jgi:hypothetical protein
LSFFIKCGFEILRVVNLIELPRFRRFEQVFFFLSSWFFNFIRHYLFNWKLDSFIFICLVSIKIFNNFKNNPCYPSSFYLSFFVESSLTDFLNWYFFYFILQYYIDWELILFSSSILRGWSFLILGFMIFFSFLSIYLSQSCHLDCRFDKLA